MSALAEPMSKQSSIHLIAAARPNFMKVAPLLRQLRDESWCQAVLVHTGQHYDSNMSDTFFHDLQMRPPDYHLEIGSGTHAEQTGRVMIAYEQLCFADRPQWIIVVGDVNSTMACAIVGAKLGIKVAHLEAGLRSRDRSMPEEINRVVTDAIADLLWTPSRDADANLRAEGVPDDRIEFVGNIMIDCYESMRDRIASADMARRHGFASKSYAVVTLHRPANVDDFEILQLLVSQLCKIAVSLPLVFPVHPRTLQRLQAFGLFQSLLDAPGIRVVEPMGYLEFMSFVSEAALIITDSGGVQEETTYLGIPCITVRDTTERPITLVQGTNRLVKPPRIYASVQSALGGDWPKGCIPERWDGQTADRVVASLKRRVMAALDDGS